MKIKNIEQGESYNGYYLFTPSTDFFFITNDRRKGLHMVAVINHYLDKHHGFKNIYIDGTDVKKQLQRGTIELKSCSHGDYYSINGDGWGCGDLVKNRQTIIYQYDNPKRYSRKQLKQMVNDGVAIDVTNASEVTDIPEEVRQIGYVPCGGKLLIGDSGQLYAITDRTTAIYLF